MSRGSAETINLSGRIMFVSSIDTRGVVGAGTRLHFAQKGARVFARYHGGSISRGCLMGKISGMQLTFGYVQVETSGEIHGGRSICDIQLRRDGGIRIIEHFTWSTRSGSGTNIFDEFDKQTPPER